MKNKKLFAILTLVCFMFTLMPVAAFAADPYLTVNSADDSKTLAATDTAALAVANPAAEGYWFFMLDGDGDVVGRLPLNSTTAASYSFAVANYAGGTYDVYAVKADAQVTTVLNSGARYAEKVDALFDDHDALILDSVQLKVKGATTNYNITLSSTNTIADIDADGIDEIVVNANNGFNNDKVTATLSKVGGSTVKDAKLTYSTAGFVNVTPVDQVTGRDGKADFMIAASRAGEFRIYVTYGDATKALDVVVNPIAVANVAVEKAPTAPVALDSAVADANVKFKFTDANGANYSINGATDRTVKYNLTLISKPADSGLETSEIYLDGTGSTLTLKATEAFDEEGDYTFRVSLQNGAAATATVSVKEYDKTVGIKFNDTVAKTVAYNGTFTIAATDVKAVDANGVTKAVAAPATIDFSVAGKAVQSFDGSNLVVKDDDYIGQKVTVYAVYKEAGKTFTAAHEVTVIDTAAEVVYTATDAEVAVNNTLYANVVDSNGNKVILPAATTVQVIVLDKPETAVAVVSGEWDTTYNRINTGLLVSEAGEYTIQTIVTYTTGTPAVDWYLTSIDTITVGAVSGEFKDVVVMSIGANKVVVNSDVKAIPAAPMIKDQRTFVPFRALAEAFGADVEWVEATQSVVAELNGVKVVMNIGEEVYTVNGVEKTADVAPFINGASTMVPVRFVAEAFGITVTPIYAEDGSVADVLFAK